VKSGAPGCVKSGAPAATRTKLIAAIPENVAMEHIDLQRLHFELVSADPMITRKAVARIAGMVDKIDKHQVPDVIEMLASLFYIDLGDKPEYFTVVEETLSTIASFGEPAIPALMDLLSDTDLKATLMIGRALGRIGPPAFGALRNFFYRAATPYQKVLSMFALAKMHEAALMEIFPDLVVALDDSDREVRDTAARTLGRVVDSFKPGQLPRDQASHAFERLMFRLHDPSSIMRSKVIRSIGKLAKNLYLDPEQLESASDSIECLMGKGGCEPDEHYMVRREAEEAMQYITDATEM
jgi:HEAT repeat protein